MRGDSSCRGSAGPVSLHSSGALKSKPPTLHPFIQGFGVTSFSPVSWEGDSMHAVFPEIKAWRTVPALTAGAVLPALTNPAFSGLGGNGLCS